MNLYKEAHLFARFRFFFWLLIGVWTGCIVGSFLWNLRQQADRSRQLARRTAQITFENDVLYRRWAAEQGGVYVRVSESCPPNPHLKVPDRDVTTTSDVALTLVNPAYMARQVNAMAGATGGSRGHLTSLRPIRPENAPDPWEAAALESFEEGETEVHSVEPMAGGEYLRLMRPFFVEQGCLKCHAAQGYELGDVRGGVSVSVPMASLRAIERPMTARLALAHLGLWGVGLIGIGFFRRSLGKEILGRERAEAEIKTIAQQRQLELESRVQERTAELNRALQTVEAEQRRFQEVLDQLPVYVVLLSSDYHVPFANSFFEGRFGKSNGHRCYEYLFDRTEPCENCETYKVLKTGAPHRWEWTGPDSRDYDVFDFPFTDVDGSPMIMEVGLDITEIKEANEKLEQRVAERTEDLLHAKAAAEAASEAKGQFLANMSHELRTPMNAILGMIDVALPKAADPTVLDCLQTAKGSADLLLTLLNDLLDSAKIESGKLDLESEPFSLRRMLDQITQVLSVRASEKGLSFCCRVPKETPDAVIGDRTRLQQVLINLAGNAVKFTERGEVEITVESRESRTESPALDSELLTLDSVVLEFAVRDTGIGIPPSGLERLFQPFAQADASMMRRFGGTGLGLSISKNLVELMGGRIWVESELGTGSMFHVAVRLPLAKELPPDFGSQIVVPTTACAQLCVLLVEDNPANQKLATYVLQDRGHTVQIAVDGQEAIVLTEQNHYDVILMDVQMPGMNGLEATAAIRGRENADSHVPIIAMTAHAMRGDRERCLAAGMDGYLSKPVNAQEMIGLVEALACGGGVSSSPLDSASSGSAKALPPTTLVFDPDEAITRCFNSADMVWEMIQCFYDEVDNLFPQMRAALEKGNLVEVGRLGHRMKGTVVYLGAHRAKEAALRVERFCKCPGGTPSEAINALERECIALKAALVRHPLAVKLAKEG